MSHKRSIQNTMSPSLNIRIYPASYRTKFSVHVWTNQPFFVFYTTNSYIALLADDTICSCITHILNTVVQVPPIESYS